MNNAEKYQRMRYQREEEGKAMVTEYRRKQAFSQKAQNDDITNVRSKFK